MRSWEHAPTIRLFNEELALSLKGRGIALGIAVYPTGVLGYCFLNFVVKRQELMRQIDERLIAGARTAQILAETQHHGLDASRALDPES